MLAVLVLGLPATASPAAGVGIGVGLPVETGETASGLVSERAERVAQVSDPILLLSPSGTTPDPTPAYVFVGAPEATWYRLIIIRNGQAIRSGWFTKEQAGCPVAGGLCTIQPTGNSAEGQPWAVPVYSVYEWQVQLWKPSGQTLTSRTKSFWLNSGPGWGFDSQFNGSNGGWSPVRGTWNLYSLQTQGFHSTGIRDQVSSMARPDRWTNFVYETKVWREGCGWLGAVQNSIWIRATPGQLSEPGYWRDGYRFMWSAVNPVFGVYQDLNGVATQLAFGNSSAINTASNTGKAWNTIRVTAFRNRVAIAINGTTVWNGNVGNSYFTEGQVGFGFLDEACGSDPTTSNFWIDYAVLNTLSG